MAPDQIELEPIDPRTARELYLDHKELDCSEATVVNHRYRLKPFLEWCEENEIDNLNDISGRDLQTYRLWRRENSDIKPVTMRMQMGTLRVFIKWAASIEAVPQTLSDKVVVPSVPPEARERDETLEAEHAQRILAYLSKFQYASNEHVLLALLWETGIRIGGANSLDVADVDFENGHLRLVHRPDEGTTLKNGEGGERLIALTSDLAMLLGDYIDESRNPLKDNYGRQPLLTTSKARMSRATMRRLIYRVTAPCYFDEPCPDCSEGEDRRCGGSVSPHSVRRGSITHYLTKDVPVDVVSDRMNVSRKTLEKHYDKRTEEVKVEQRRDHIEEIQ
jgi:integrase